MGSGDTDTEALMDSFLESRGHDTSTWEQDYNKKQCPDCGGIHTTNASKCTVCGWEPTHPDR